MLVGLVVVVVNVLPEDLHNVSLVGELRRRGGSHGQNGQNGGKHQLKPSPNGTRIGDENWASSVTCRFGRRYVTVGRRNDM